MKTVAADLSDEAVSDMDDVADFGMWLIGKTNGADLRPLVGDLIPFERIIRWPDEPEDTCGW